MSIRADLVSWWRPLPLWLKLVAVLGAYPSWFFIIYCVLTEQAKSAAAYVAFSILVLCTILHIIFDRRNRRSIQESAGGVELGDGG